MNRNCTIKHKTEVILHTTKSWFKLYSIQENLAASTVHPLKEKRFKDYDIYTSIYTNFIDFRFKQIKG